MRKRLVSAALAAAMALSMTACTSNPAEKETEAAAPADTEAAEEGEEKEAAADGDLITVGYAQVGAESDWRTANTESFKSTFTEENGYKLIFDDAQQKQENQIKAIRSFIQQGDDDIDVVICENDNEAFGAIDAIKAAGKTCGPEGDIIVVSFDSVKAAFESMIAGDLNATFECNPLHGPRVAEIIQKLEKGEEVEKIQYVDEAYFDTSMDLEEILKTRAY